MSSALAPFHPHTRAWFAANFPAPTDVQRRSWPVISAGGHALITAPTGSGKTLTAFLWALDAFAALRYASGATRVLYISPLKALNNDIQRNLLEPLGGLRARFEAADETFPEIRVQVRSGDTDPSERQRMLRRPPEILITTPESLALLLTTPRGRHALATVETVILDEIHAVADNRRGTVLMTALERLARCAGDFQRIALSATVHPLEEIAAFVAGRDHDHAPRPIDIIEGRDDKQIEFRVRFPDHVRAALDAGAKIWEPLTQTFRAIIAANAATLFFTNSRRLAEKITLTINSTEATPLAYAHHGSLAREIRTEVEQRLKSGALRAIVATNSLEMGIDIGSLDEVVLIQSPPSIASALQRIGRAGHRVGDVSRGTLFPTHARDFLEGAALAECIEARELEPLAVIENPLDVLAQIIISMTASETWTLDDIYALLRQSYSYRTLPREQFELVVEMLAGRYAGSRVRDLKPRVVFDRIEQTLRASKGAVYALYTSGGTIPDRGYYHLRHADTGALIGDLDEEFVFEAQVGSDVRVRHPGLADQAHHAQRRAGVARESRLCRHTVLEGGAKRPQLPLLVPHRRFSRTHANTTRRQRRGRIFRCADDTTRFRRRGGAGTRRLSSPPASAHGRRFAAPAPRARRVHSIGPRRLSRPGSGTPDRAAHAVGRPRQQTVRAAVIRRVGGDARARPRDSRRRRRDRDSDQRRHRSSARDRPRSR